jgi:hypothetical protein
MIVWNQSFGQALIQSICGCLIKSWQVGTGEGRKKRRNPAGPHPNHHQSIHAHINNILQADYMHISLSGWPGG